MVSIAIYDINLYRPELLPKPLPLSFKSMMRIWMVVLLALIMFGAKQQWQLRVSQKALLLARQEQEQANDQLADYEQRYPPIVADAALQERIAEREQELRSKTLMLRSLESRQEKKPEGFSRFLSGFSRRHLAGLWLQEIEVDEKSRLSLSGQVLDPKLLPRYLENISNDAAFANQSFQTFRMEQPVLLAANDGATLASPINALHFELRSERADASAKTETAP